MSRRISFLPILVLLILAIPLHAQWTQTNGPCGGQVYSLAVSGTNLFAGTLRGGVFRSTNNGTSWTAINSGLTTSDIGSLAVSGTSLFAGTWGSGVFLSTNNGTSWTAVNAGLPGDLVFALSVSGTNLFAGTRGSGVFLSTNNGTSWTQVNAGLTNTDVWSLAVSGTNLFAGTAGGVFLSTNNGTSWTAANAGLTNIVVSSLAVSGTNLFAGTVGGGVFLSTDNGTSWTAANTGLTNTIVWALAFSGTNLFGGTGGGVFLSTDNGTSWTAANAGLTNSDVRSFAISGTNLFAGIGGGGVFLSTDNGTSWTAANAGLRSTDVWSLTVSGTNLFAGTSGSGVFLSTNNGTSWTAANAGMTTPYVRSVAVLGTKLLAGTGSGVFLSTNNGTSWTQVNAGLTNTDVWSLAVSGTNLFAGTAGGVFLSTNIGTSWTAASTGLPNTNVWSLAVSGTSLFAGTWGSGVFLSTNNGTSWFAVNTGLTSTSIYALAVSATSLFAGTWGGGGVFRSTDSGTSWTAVGLTSTPVSSLAVSGTNIFAGTLWGSVFRSTDNGTSWAAASTGLPNTDVRSLAVSGTNLFAGTEGGGVFRRSLNDWMSPIAPTNLTALAGNQQVRLTWNRSAAMNVLKYYVYQGTAPSPTTIVDSTSTVSDTMKVITGLTNGTNYFFRITAVDSSGNESTYSNEVNATPFVFPLVLQPGPLDGKDTYVSSKNPSTNHGADPFIWFGGIAWEADTFHLYIRFDLSSIPPGTSISNARLDFFMNGQNGGMAYDYGVYKVFEDWSKDSLTWNNRPQNDSVPTIVFNGGEWDGAINQWHSIKNLEALIQKWVDHPVGNYGLVVKPVNQFYGNPYLVSSDYTFDSSLRPRLVIDTQKTLIKGTVKDSQTQLPLAGTIVDAYQEIPLGGLRVFSVDTTDQSGMFELEVPYSGWYKVRARGMNGYFQSRVDSAQVVEGGNATINIEQEPNAHAVGRIASGIWTRLGSPYIVTADIEILGRFVIEPGVRVLFAGHFKMNVSGSLNAVGTVSDSIVFSRYYQTAESRGWGIRISSATSDTSRLAYCVIEQGYASDEAWNSSIDDTGGGISCVNSNVIVENCRIRNNSATTGAGIYALISGQKTLLIRGNLIENNVSFNQGYTGCGGGGINIEGGSAIDTVERNVITGNSYSGNDANYEGGGGISLSYGQVAILNNTIYGNSSPKGSGIHVSRGYGGVIENNIVWGNIGSVNQDQISIESGYAPAAIPAGLSINYNDIQDSAIVVVFRNSPQGIRYTNGISNIARDPYFANVSIGNYGLQAGSPCIDAGNPLARRDPDGTIADIGAIYFDHVVILPPPSSWNFTSNTGNNGTIAVPSAINPSTGTRALQTGDAVGVFFTRNDSLICAGYGLWQYGQNMAITAWGDNDQTTMKDGFAPGELIQYKLWDAQAGKELNAFVQYQMGGTTYTSNGIYQLSSLVGVTSIAHSIRLPQGWNMISSYVAPKDSTLDTLFAKIKPNMVITKNGGGKVYWPALSINTIGKWRSKDGYQIYMQSTDTVKVVGDEINPQQVPLILSQGWTLMSYLRNSAMRSDSAVTTLGGNVVIMKNGAGQVYWPALSINTIVTMKPGQGYQLYLSAGSTLTYPANAASSPPSMLTKTASVAEMQQEMLPEHYKVEKTGTGSNATLVVKGIELKDGDEVGVRGANGKLIGSGVVQSNRAVMAVWGDNVLTEEKEGAAEGETVALTVWSKSGNKERPVTITSLTDGLTSQKVSSILKYATDGVWEAEIGEVRQIPTVFSLEQNYPNPFNPSTVIRYGIPKDVRVRLEVYNVLGQKLVTLVDQDQKAGYYDVVFDARSFSSGVYFYMLNGGEFRQTKKLMLLR